MAGRHPPNLFRTPTVPPATNTRCRPDDPAARSNRHTPRPKHRTDIDPAPLRAHRPPSNVVRPRTSHGPQPGPPRSAQPRIAPPARTNESKKHEKGPSDPCRKALPCGSSAADSGVLERRLVRYGEFLAALRTARSQHLAAVRRSHTSAETVLVDALATRRLVGSLHCHSYILFIVSDFFTDCKSTTKISFAKIFRENISARPEKARKLAIFVRGPIRSRTP